MLASGSYHIILAGIISDEDYHACIQCIKELKTKYPTRISSTELAFFPTQWDQYLKQLQTQLKGEFYIHRGSPIAFVNGCQYIGGKVSFLEWALQEFRYTDSSSNLIYKKLASDAYRNAINNTPGRSYVWMKINPAASMGSKVLIELFEDICPKTCENFKKLCEGFERADKVKIGYCGTEITRVVPGMYVQGGDIKKVFNNRKSSH
jgi:hypothetical protein